MSIIFGFLMFLSWLLCFVLILAIIISLLKIRLNIGYFEKKMYLAIYFYDLKIFSMHRSIDKKEKEEQGKIEFQALMDNFKKWTKVFKENKEDIGVILKLASKKIRIQTYSIIMDIGVGNAATTGIICGAASAFIGLITAFIGNYIDIDERTSTIVNPKSDKVFDISGNIIINFRIIELLELAWQASKTEAYRKIKAMINYH